MSVFLHARRRGAKTGGKQDDQALHQRFAVWRAAEAAGHRGQYLRKNQNVSHGTRHEMQSPLDLLRRQTGESLSNRIPEALAEPRQMFLKYAAQKLFGVGEYAADQRTGWPDFLVYHS